MSDQVDDQGSTAGDHAGSVPAGDSGNFDHSGLFVRKSSGLVRELGIRDALSIAIAGVSPAYSVILFSVFLTFASDVDLTWPYLVVPILFLPLCFVYAQLVMTMPRSGGDYVYLSRIFHPIAGAAIGGAFILFQFANAGYTTVGIAGSALPEAFRVAGSVFSIDTLSTFSESLGSDQFTQFATALVALAIAYSFGFFGSRALSRVMFWFFIAGLVAVGTMGIVAITHSTGDFQAAYDSATKPGAYNGVIAAAQENGLKTGSTIDGFIKYLPYAAIGFYGFTLANFPAGELKRGGRSYILTTTVGLAICAAFVVAGWLAVKQVAGQDFIQSAAALSAAKPGEFTQITGGASTSPPYYMDLVGGSIPSLIISVGLAISFCLFALVTVIILSRLIFAMSFDRLLPSKLSNVSEKRHVPVNALIVSFIGSAVFIYLVVYSTGFVQTSRNLTLVWAAIFSVGSLAAAVLPYRRPDLFGASPQLSLLGRRALGGVPILTLVAIISALTQMCLFYIAASNAGISGGYDAGSIAFLVGIAFVGVVVYAISRTYLKRSKGVDISQAMRELPPD